jgi:hypothetical protein
VPARVTETLRRALGYPYAAPDESFVFRDGRACALDPAALTGRTPVLAHGSNRAPGQLARKFADFPGRAGTIPVTYLWLHDYDVVYSAHVTRYGAIASTLQHTPECRVRVAVTWLDDAQLARMHATEGNYTVGVLAGARMASEVATPPLDGHLLMYRSARGPLTEAGTPVGLAAVHARPRPHPARTQGQMLEALRRAVAPKRAFEPFIRDLVTDPGLRRVCTDHLAATAAPADVPHFREV